MSHTEDTISCMQDSYRKLESLHLQVYSPVYHLLRAEVAKSVWLLGYGLENPGFTFEQGKTFLSLP